MSALLVSKCPVRNCRRRNIRISVLDQGFSPYQHMEHLPKIMSIGDVIDELNVSRQRIYEFIRKGKLHPQDTAAGKIFLASEVAAFKKERLSRIKKR